jgi:hypothetical protein
MQGFPYKINGTLLHIAASSTGNSGNHWHMQFCQTTGTLVLLVQAIILPNHWHIPPHTGNSAKSLAQHRQFCQITGTLIHVQAILPNHWHTVYRQTMLPNHWHAPPHTCNSAKSLARSSTYLQFCQNTGTLLKIQAILLSLTGWPAQVILPSHWHTHLHTGNSAKSMAHCAQAILPNHWHKQFCQITGAHCPTQTVNSAKESLAHCPQTDTNSAKSLAHSHPHTGNSAK